MYGCFPGNELDQNAKNDPKFGSCVMPKRQKFPKKLISIIIDIYLYETWQFAWPMCPRAV